MYFNDVKSKLFPLGSSGCRSNLPAALFGMKILINEAGKEKKNITKQRDSKSHSRKQKVAPFALMVSEKLLPTKY